MAELRRSPEYKSIVPIVALAFLREDKAVAQIAQTAQPQPTSSPTSIDPVTTFGYLAAAGIAGFAFLPKILSQWFAGAIATKEKKESIEIQQDKERADFYLKEADKKSALFDEVFKTMLANVLQSSAENKEIYYELTKVIEALTEKISTLEQTLTSNTDQTQRGFTSLTARINDITSLLKDRERNSD